MKLYENFVTGIFKKKDIFDLIKDEDIKGIKKYIDNGGDIEITEEHQLLTPVLTCARSGVDIRITELFVAAGADLYKVSRSGKNFFDQLAGFYTPILFPDEEETETLPRKWYFWMKYPNECKKVIDFGDRYTDYYMTYTFLDMLEKANKIDEFDKLFPGKIEEYKMKKNLDKYKI